MLQHIMPTGVRAAIQPENVISPSRHACLTVSVQHDVDKNVGPASPTFSPSCLSFQHLQGQEKQTRLRITREGLYVTGVYTRNTSRGS